MSTTKQNRPWHQGEIRSINLIDKPGLSTRSINLVYRPGSVTLENLRGNPLRVIRFLFSAVDDFNQKTTRKIQLCEIAHLLEITKDSARTGLRFLNKSGLISTLEYFPGLNGWTRYKIQDALFDEMGSLASSVEK